jgi:hypothetical protein
MKKRFNLTWRVVTALLLVLALVPALVVSVATAATTPTTYVDQLPSYWNGAGPFVLSGTSATGALVLDRVRIQVKNYDPDYACNRYWDGGAWTNAADTYVFTSSVTESDWNGQWDWSWAGLAGLAPLADGSTYYISAWAVDENDNMGTEAKTQFIYDQYGTISADTYPVVIMNPAIDGEDLTSLTIIKGTASDKMSPTLTGTVGVVFVEIIYDPAGAADYWDGSNWVAGPVTLLATGTTSWSISTSTVPCLPSWEQGAEYEVNVWAYDKAGNFGNTVTSTFDYCKSMTPSTSTKINVDTVPAYITPANLWQLTGTATATTGHSVLPAGGSVKVWLTDKSSSQNFDGSDWVTVYDTWFEVDTYTDPSCSDIDEQNDWASLEGITWPTDAEWTAGNTYQVKVKATDDNSKTTTSSVQTFIVDDEAPTNTIINTFWVTTTYDATVFGSLKSISGTSADITGGTAAGAVDRVEISIENSDGDFWDGNAWSAILVWHYASGTTSWTFGNMPNWMHENADSGPGNGVYTISARAIDKAGNDETPVSETFTFIKDLSGTAPVATEVPTPTAAPTPAPALVCAVTNPVNNANLSALASINGTSADDAAVLGLKVRIYNVSSALYWNGSAWVANLSLVDAPAATASDGAFNSISEPWSYTTLPTWGTGSTYQVQAQAADATTTAADSSVVAFGFGVTPAATPTPTPTTAATPTPTTTPTTTPTAAPTPTPSGTNATESIPASGGTITTADDKVAIEFPSGAFDSATTVTITSTACHDDAGDFEVAGTCFRVEPAGTLGEAATICVDVSSYDNPEDLTLGYWDVDTWVEADNVTLSSDGNTLCGEADHFSDWAVLSSTGGWLWWYWALIGGGAFIVVLAIILLIVLPKRGKGEEIPSEELYGEEEEEF